MNRTSIGWTNWSSNPIYAVTEDGKRGHACVHASLGCLHCYSEAMNTGRFGTGLPYNVASLSKVKFVLNEKELQAWGKRNLHLGKKDLPPEMVFVEDMSDLFGEWVTDEMLDQVFGTMEDCTKLVFQILTKRHERMHLFVKRRYRLGAPSHIWFGVSVEDGEWYKKRLPAIGLIALGFAENTFVSFEPLIGDVGDLMLADGLFGGSYNWAIIGGESGKNSRPCEIEWIESIVRQCKEAGVAVFTKQDSALRPGQQGRIPNELWLKEFPK